MNPTPNKLRVLIGGAHPEGQLDDIAIRKLEERRATLMTDRAQMERTDALEQGYFEHPSSARVLVECKELAQIDTCLKLRKHLTFIQYQNDILDGNFPASIEADIEVEKEMYLSFMRHLLTHVQDIYSRYSSEVPFRDGTILSPLSPPLLEDANINVNDKEANQTTT